MCRSACARGRALALNLVLRVRSLLLTLVVLFGAVQAFGERAFAAVSCAESCPDDDDEGSCPPNCSCVCCPHAVPIASARVLPVRLPAPRRIRIEQRDTEPPAAPLADILHVPKPVLA